MAAVRGFHAREQPTFVFVVVGLTLVLTGRAGQQLFWYCVQAWLLFHLLQWLSSLLRPRAQTYHNPLRERGAQAAGRWEAGASRASSRYVHDGVPLDARAASPDSRFVTLLASGCMHGGLAAAIMLPSPIRAALPPLITALASWGLMPLWLRILLLSLHWLLRALGAAAGCWLAASAIKPTHSVPFTPTFVYAALASAAAELHARSAVYAASALLLSAFGSVAARLLASPLLVPSVQLLSTSAAAALTASRHSAPAYRPELLASGSQGVNARRRRARLLVVINACMLAALGATAVTSHGGLSRASPAAFSLLRRLRRGDVSALRDFGVHAWYYAFGGQHARGALEGAGQLEAEREACAALGVSPGATIGEVKAAFRALALETHPDKVQGRGASADEIDEVSARPHRPRLASSPSRVSSSP